MTQIVLDKTSITKYVGQTEILTVYIEPEDAIDKNVIWNSNNTEIATVSDGVVTALSAGTTTITVTTTDGSAKTASCKVIVEENITDVNSEESMRKLCNANIDKIEEKLSNETFRNDLFKSATFQNALVDIGEQANIVEVLKSSSEYKTEIANTLENNWNEKLNTIAYWCETNCWLYHEGNFCTGITGGWGYTESLTNYSKSTININGSTYMEINANKNTAGEAGSIHTLNKIQMSPYKRVTFKFNISNATSIACGAYGIASSLVTKWLDGYEKWNGWNNNTVTGTVTKEVDIGDYNEEYYAQMQAYCNVMKVYNVRIYVN